jgi:hypothetical protein
VIKGRAGDEKKVLKKEGPGVGEEKKMITFAARFGRNGGKNERKVRPAGRARYTGVL